MPFDATDFKIKRIFQYWKNLHKTLKKIWNFLTADEIPCAIHLWTPLGVSDMPMVWLLVSSQDTWVSYSNTCLLHLDTAGVYHNSDTEHRCFSAAWRGSCSNQCIWGSTTWSAIEGYKWNWSTWFSSLEILYLPTCFFGGTFLGCIEEDFFLCTCLLVFEAFFVQAGVLSLLKSSNVEKKPLCNSQAVSKLLLASMSM